MDKKKDSIIKFLKIAISLGLMIYLLKQTNWVDIGNTLKDIRIKYFLYGSIFPVFIIPVMAAIRWKLLLAPGKIKISLIDIIKLTYTGLFFNLVLPGSVGGDTIKGVIFYRLTKNSSLSASSIFLDRIIGLFALAILSVISSSIYYKISSDNSFLLVAAFLLLFLIVFLGLSLITSIQKNFLFCLKWIKVKKVEEFMEKNLEFLSWFKKNPKILISTILISLFLPYSFNSILLHNRSFPEYRNIRGLLFSFLPFNSSDFFSPNINKRSGSKGKRFCLFLP